MFAHKEISHGVRGRTRSENARHLLVWVYRERCVHILYAFWAYYTQYLCWFCTAKASLRPPLHHAMCSLVKRHACVRAKRLRMRDKDLTAICDRTKKNNEAGISTRAFPLESPSNKLRYQASESKNGVGNDLFGKNRRSNFCDILSAWLKAKVLFAMNTANLQLFGDRGECHIHPKKWHKMRDKRPLFVARCSQPTNSVFFLGCAGSKFGYFSQFTVFVWKCNMTLIWDLRNSFGIKDETSVNLEISSKAATH